MKKKKENEKRKVNGKEKMKREKILFGIKWKREQEKEKKKLVWYVFFDGNEKNMWGNITKLLLIKIVF